MTGPHPMTFRDAVRLLSDRGEAVVRPARPVGTPSLPVAVISLATLSLAAVPLVLLDPDRVDGVPLLLSLFLFPMVAGSLIIELVVLCRLRGQEPRWTLLWWPLAVLPLGLLAMGVGPVLAHPDYFDVTGAASVAGVLVTFAVLIGLGLGLASVVWALVVLPVRVLGLAAVDALAGARVERFRVVTPLVLLAIPTVSLLVVVAIGGLEADRTVVVPVVLAVLGIPGEYEIRWAPGLWIVRVIVLALIGVAIAARVRSRASRTP